MRLNTDRNVFDIFLSFTFQHLAFQGCARLSNELLDKVGLKDHIWSASIRGLLPGSQA